MQWSSLIYVQHRVACNNAHFYACTSAAVTKKRKIILMISRVKIASLCNALLSPHYKVGCFFTLPGSLMYGHKGLIKLCIKVKFSSISAKPIFVRLTVCDLDQLHYLFDTWHKCIRTYELLASSCKSVTVSPHVGLDRDSHRFVFIGGCGGWS